MWVEHSDLVYIAKSYGLIGLMIGFALAVLYAYWPANRAPFERVARSIVDDEDKPCR